METVGVTSKKKLIRYWELEVKVVGNGIFSISYDSYWPVYGCSTHFDARSTFTSKVYLFTSIFERNRVIIVAERRILKDGIIKKRTQIKFKMEKYRGDSRNF